jgi:hypothetical protein
MLPSLLEWCADAFGVTRRGHWFHLVMGCALLVSLGFALGERWGALAAAVPALLLLGAIAPALQVLRARALLWRTALLGDAELRATGQEPTPDAHLFGGTAGTLHRLAQAVLMVRRGAPGAAREWLGSVDRSRLFPEEDQLVDTVHALVQDLERDHTKGREPGRALVAALWHDPERLAAALGAWDRAGLDARSTSARSGLPGLVRVRIDPPLLDQLAPDEARALAEEAQAIGDERLAAELASKSRASAYR